MVPSRSAAETRSVPPGSTGADAHLAYVFLRQALMDGRVRPGARLNPDLLADPLRVSRTPIREALIRLEAEGLIAARRYHGFFAKMLDAKELDDLYDVVKVVFVQALAGRSLISRRVEDHDAPEVEHLIRAASTALGNAEATAIADRFLVRTHFVRSIHLERRPRFIPHGLRPVARGGEWASERVSRRLTRLLTVERRRLPDLVRIANARASASELP